jgi:small neutral amino acid transporter SnatA (MarC family)
MFDTIDFYLVFDLFLLLLIGMGPKIALVPFLELTQGMEADTQRKIANTMVRTAVGTALLLVILGWFLMRLLHFTPGAANVAGGIVLLLISLNMMVSPAKKHDPEAEVEHRDPQKMAIYPLAVPYLLNPAGIATLVIVSDDIDSLLFGAIVIGVVLLVGLIDFAVFRNMDKLSKHLDPSRLVITEVIFGVLLTALAVQLMADGMAEMGIISGLVGH